MRRDQRLPTEEELAPTLGISRPSVREGLKAVAAKGLVDARAIFEPAAARLAAERASGAQVDAITRASHGMAECLPHDLEGCHRHDLVFHEGIIAASGNALLMRLALMIRTGLLSLFSLSANARESYENSPAEHQAVADAIRRRSPDEAEQAMRVLLRGTVRDLDPAFRPAKRRPTSQRKARHGSHTVPGSGAGRNRRFGTRTG
jgi:DNA-binding FadR family transcriptional regulator